MSTARPATMTRRVTEVTELGNDGIFTTTEPEVTVEGVSKLVPDVAGVPIKLLTELYSETRTAAADVPNPEPVIVTKPPAERISGMIEITGKLFSESARVSVLVCPLVVTATL